MSIQMKPRPDCTPDGAENDDLLEDARGEVSHDENGKRKPKWKPRQPRVSLQIKGIPLTWRTDDKGRERFQRLQEWADFVAGRSNLGIGPMRLALFMLTRFNSRHTYFSVSKETAATALGTFESQISKWRGAMIDAGVLVAVEGRLPGKPDGRKTTYFLPALPLGVGSTNSRPIEDMRGLQTADPQGSTNSGSMGSTNTRPNHRQIIENDQERLREDEDYQRFQDEIEEWALSGKGKDQSLTEKPSSETDPDKGLPEQEDHEPHPDRVEASGSRSRHWLLEDDDELPDLEELEP